MMVAKGLSRQAQQTPMAGGGVAPYPSGSSDAALRQAIMAFNKRRQSDIERPVLTSDNWAHGIDTPASGQPPQMLRAEPPPSPSTPKSSELNQLGQDAKQAGDLGQTLQDGYDMITGKPKAQNPANVNPGIGKVNLTGSNVPPAGSDTLSGLMNNIAKIESGGWKNQSGSPGKQNARSCRSCRRMDS